MDSKETRAFHGVMTGASGLFIISVIVYFLVIADKFLIPLVLAVLIWYLLNTIDHFLSLIKIGDWRPPRYIRLLLAITALVLFFNMVTGVVISNVSQIVQAAPTYQENFEKLLQDLPLGIELADIPALNRLTTEFNLGQFMQTLTRESTAFLGYVGLILIYLIFLFLEGRYFRDKLTSVAGEERKQLFIRMLSRFDRDIKRYIGVKTLLSLATAFGSWLIMKAVGLDYAEFWAVLIFVLNFIPNLGSVVATILPSLLALLQFDSLMPFFVILLGVGALQFVIGNLLDPALMGKSLNVSPLIIIISLVFWGAIWGLPGMFLCVPITVILMIILHSFDQTRWIALMMSRDGKFKD